MFYENREQEAGGTNNPWSEAAGFDDHSEEGTASDVKFSLSGAISQGTLAVAQSYDKVMVSDQGLYGSK